jgi:hypothetical protein
LFFLASHHTKPYIIKISLSHSLLLFYPLLFSPSFLLLSLSSPFSPPLLSSFLSPLLLSSLSLLSSLFFLLSLLFLPLSSLPSSPLFYPLFLFLTFTLTYTICLQEAKVMY